MSAHEILVSFLGGHNRTPISLRFSVSLPSVDARGGGGSGEDAFQAGERLSGPRSLTQLTGRTA